MKPFANVTYLALLAAAIGGCESKENSQQLTSTPTTSVIEDEVHARARDAYEITLPLRVETRTDPFFTADRLYQPINIHDARSAARTVLWERQYHPMTSSAADLAAAEEDVALLLDLYALDGELHQQVVSVRLRTDTGDASVEEERFAKLIAGQHRRLRECYPSLLAEEVDPWALPELWTVLTRCREK